MTNIRLKKTDSSSRQKESPEEAKTNAKNESFPDGSQDDELSKKRKMILTGISAGVGVAGAAAAGLLFFGPYSPFNGKENEKQDSIPKDKQVVATPMKEESSKVQVPQAQVVEQAKVIAAPAAKDQSHVPHNQIAVLPTAPKKELKEKPVPEKVPERVEKSEIPPPFINPKNEVAIADVKEANGPTVYNYDILDGGPILNIPLKRKVYVSRDPNFKKMYLNGTSDSSGKYRISIPPPGDIYWKDENDKIHKMTITPPESSAILADIPEHLKLKDSIKWNASGKVSFYRIEIASDLDFLNRVKVFSTVKTSFPVQNIGRGRWYLKISALNLQSGTWDSTKIFPINIEETLVKPEPIANPEPKKEEAPPPQEVQEIKEPKPEQSVEIPPVEDMPVKAAEPVDPVEATVPEKTQTAQPAEE